MKIPFLDLTEQYLTIKNEIDTAVFKVISDNAFINGKYVKDFEDAFAHKHNTEYCIGVGNGTDAIHIVLKALGIGMGDEVITVANSFIATSEAVTSVGAKVVFVDCNEFDYTIDVNKIEEKITNKTKAIIPVHLYGQPCDMDEIIRIAEKYQLYIVEDAAQAHLAEYFSKDGGWKKVGCFGNAATFSFYPGKNLGAYGDAGCILTNDFCLNEKMRKYANHGRVSKYNHEFEGINSRMDGLQGAILNVKLKHLDNWTQKRRQIADKYNSLLQGLEALITPTKRDNAKHVYHLYVIRHPERDKLREYLKSKNIDTGIHYPICLPNLMAYKYLNHNKNDFPNSYYFQYQILSLPIYPELSDAMLHYIAEAINEFVNL